jgi:hypothetical protein
MTNLSPSTRRHLIPIESSPSLIFEDIQSFELNQIEPNRLPIQRPSKTKRNPQFQPTPPHINYPAKATPPSPLQQAEHQQNQRRNSKWHLLLLTGLSLLILPFNRSSFPRTPATSPQSPSPRSPFLLTPSSQSSPSRPAPKPPSRPMQRCK